MDIIHFDLFNLAFSCIGIPVAVIFSGVSLVWWMKRSFRAHLSTLIVMMLLAGLFLFFNLKDASTTCLGWPARIQYQKGVALGESDFFKMIINALFAFVFISFVAMYLELGIENPVECDK